MYGEPLLKIFSVQALLRVSFVYHVGISLIHQMNKASHMNKFIIFFLFISDE